MKNQDIKAYFANHENATAFHFTTDEFCFHTEQDAISNTKSLADKKVTTITREEAEALPAKGNYDLSTQVEPAAVDNSFTTTGAANATPPANQSGEAATSGDANATPPAEIGGDAATSGDAPRGDAEETAPVAPKVTSKTTSKTP